MAQLYLTRKKRNLVFIEPAAIHERQQGFDVRIVQAQFDAMTGERLEDQKFPLSLAGLKMEREQKMQTFEQERLRHLREEQEIMEDLDALIADIEAALQSQGQ
jgi:hypothetical protein